VKFTVTHPALRAVLLSSFNTLMKLMPVALSPRGDTHFTAVLYVWDFIALCQLLTMTTKPGFESAE